MNTDSFTELLQIVSETKEIELNPAASLDTINAWETKRKLALPPDYARFITQVGDGGVVSSKNWPGGELISFSKYEEKGYSFSHIKKAFTLTESWVPDFGDPLEEGIILSESKEEKLLQKRWAMIRDYGSIVLMESRTNDFQRWHLIINGPRVGEVWLESEFGVIRYPGCSFTEWLLKHLDGSWEKYAEDCAQKDQQVRERRKNEEGPRARCLKGLSQCRIRLNPTISIEEVNTFQEKHNIQLPEDYIKFITEIGNGGKHSRLKYPKLYSLSELNDMQGLNEPFFFQNHEQVEAVAKQLNRPYEGPHLPWDQVVRLCNLNYYGDNEKSEPWLFPVQKNLKGCIPVFSSEVSQDQTQLFLILNGEFRGEIWVSSRSTLAVRSDFRFRNGEKINFSNLWEAYLYYQYGAC